MVRYNASVDSTSRPCSVNHRRIGLRRRLIGLIVVLGFGIFTAESLIADVCDGDSGLTAVSVGESNTPASDPDGPGPVPTHTVHVCHCVHAHGGMPALLDRDPAGVPAATVALRLIQTTPPSPALELQLRPPIV